MRRDEFIAALKKNEAISVFEDERFAFLVQTGEHRHGTRHYFGLDPRGFAGLREYADNVFPLDL